MNSNDNSSTPGMTRRQFAQLLGAAGALGLVDTPTLTRVLADSKRNLAYLANRTAGAEGAWELRKIEGKVPNTLNGTLFRVAPGQKETFGVKLRHLFDGDAFISRYSFREGRVSLTAKFLETPQRLEELSVKRMLYTEAGTLAPPPPEGYKPKYGGKNQPSVNIIRWDGRLLGLSEGGHPTAVDLKTLAYQGEWDFHGTLPADVPFTAHPKFDPQTGEGYGYGVQRGMSLALTVFRMDRDGKLKKLYALPQRNYFMIHDMLLAREHLVFVIPPVYFDFMRMMQGERAAPFDLVKYSDKLPTRLLILRKDGTGQPVTVEQPPGMVFHNGNAYEQDGKLVIDSILSADDSVMKAVASWDQTARPSPNHLTRIVIDPATGSVTSRTELETEVELPRFDERRRGTNARYLYTVAWGKETGRADTLAKHDLHRGNAQRAPLGKGRTYGEPVFVPHPGQNSEERGWLLAQGYDGERDETFLEIRDAGTLEVEARIWTGQHFPLGFHGNFYAD
ncbi:MAG: carotenoid oxygenase family protein [Acidobacteriota bacterium]